MDISPEQMNDIDSINPEREYFSIDESMIEHMLPLVDAGVSLNLEGYFNGGDTDEVFRGVFWHFIETKRRYVDRLPVKRGCYSIAEGNESDEGFDYWELV